MKRAEKLAENQAGGTPLSSHMLESWDTDRVWFNYAATHSHQVDAIYWAVLCKHHPGGVAPDLPDLLKDDMENYVQHTQRQLKKYEDAWAERHRTMVQ